MGVTTILTLNAKLNASLQCIKQAGHLQCLCRVFVYDTSPGTTLAAAAVYANVVDAHLITVLALRALCKCVF